MLSEATEVRMAPIAGTGEKFGDAAVMRKMQNHWR